MSEKEPVIGGFDLLLRPERFELMQEAAKLVNDMYGIAMFEVHVHPEQVNWEGQPVHDETVRIVVGGLWSQRSVTKLSPLWDKMREMDAERQAKEQ